jgi:hypothetical protein
MSDFIPATTGLSRVFVIEGRAGPENAPQFYSCYRAQALSQSFGDVTDIQCPDPTRPGKYVTVGQFQSGEERAEITLEGRYAIDIRSTLLRLARAGCPVDSQVHFGDCENLSDHNAFKKILFLENALLSAYNTEDLGSLSDDDTSEVNESVDLSADEVYDIIASTWTVNAGDLVTNEVVDVVICDEVSCGGDCGDPSMGCNRIFAITLQAGGSPGTQGDIVFSVDGGTDWYAHDIDSLGVAEDPSAVDCLKGYIVVVSNDNGYAHYALISEFDEFGTDPDFTEVQLGFVAPPNDIYALDTMAFIVGDFGYIYRMDVAPNGVMVLDAGTLTISNLLRVHALSDSFAVATGEDGVILFTEDGTAWQLLVTPPVGVGVNITAVAVKSKTEWWIGTDAGDLYYTLNAGLNWTEKAFPGSGATVTVITDIVFSTDSIMYVSYINDTPVGVIVASFNGGYDFVAMPLGTALFPANVALNRIAACEADPELVVTVGIEAAADGIIVTGVM